MRREIKLRGRNLDMGIMWEGTVADLTTVENGILEAEDWNIDEWEQWTGLTDSKGVDIYEGDKVRVVSSHEEFEGDIRWTYGGFSICWNYQTKESGKLVTRTGSCGMAYLCGDGTKTEVIP